MKTILVPVDFSDQSLNALDYAAEVAKCTKAELILLHVYSPPPLTDIPIVIPMDDYEIVIKEKLTKIITNVEQKFGPLVVRSFVRMGFVVEEIDIASDENKADLIVMGMQGANYLTERILGSITTSLIRKSKKPVLVVSKHMQFKKLNKIMLATDGSHLNGDVYKPLKQMLKIFKAHLYVVHILPDSIMNDSYDDLVSFKFDEEWLNNSLSFHHISRENVMDGLNEFMHNHNVDMIVMVPHKHDLIERILEEPQTQKMVFHSIAPLLCLPE